ncbi:LysR family transcriptional regulator [Streptomyces sp. NPDC048282]|uniref:LysR family transcriptional regulator n=1 Tax=unclassified Streptomyces TaxID=2593676 RepID=UPI003723316A
MDVRGLDLNLLIALRALLEEQNVTRAGERLQLSQPATSAALAKLRRHFNDPLLVRQGRVMELTPVAHFLLPLVIEALTQVDRVLAVRSDFDAAASDRRFLITASEYASVVINARLQRILGERAPGVSLGFTPPQPVPDILGELLRHDLLIAPLGYGYPGMHHVLFRDRFVCMLDAENPALTKDCSPLRLLNELPHAVGQFGGNITTPADQLVELIGVRRQVAVSLYGLSALPLMVLGTEMITLVPARLAQALPGRERWAVVEIPGAAERPLVEAVYWHPSRRADRALQWFLGVLFEACSGLDEQPSL